MRIETNREQKEAMRFRQDRSQPRSSVKQPMISSTLMRKKV